MFIPPPVSCTARDKAGGVGGGTLLEIFTEISVINN